MKLKLDWLVLRVGVNGRFLTINIPVPSFLTDFLIVYWIDIVGVLLLGSFVAFASMKMIYTLPVYLMGMAFYAALIHRLINDIKKDERWEQEWVRVTLFAKNPALLEYVIVATAGLLWPVTFFLITFNEWFTGQKL